MKYNTKIVDYKNLRNDDSNNNQSTLPPSDVF